MGRVGESGRMARLYAWLLSHLAAGAVLAVALTAGLGAAGLRVRNDYSLEQLFPVGDAARLEYDRYKRQFPGEDARAVVLVSAADLRTPVGLRALAALEGDLARLPHVVRVLGPASVDHVALTRFGPARERLLAPDLPAAELERRAREAELDPLLGWNLFTPGGGTVSILADLDSVAAGSDAGRAAFSRQAEAVLARHARGGQTLLLSGLPTVRTRIAALVAQDVARFVPLAVLLVFALLLVAFRSAAAAVAGLVTLLVALVWTYGVLGILGWPLGMLMGILPIMVAIVSVGDTVHIVTALFARFREGDPPRAAVASALARTAVPCLMTELVLAAGFLTLLAIRIQAAIQFGLLAAAAMLLTWLSNALVLPLALSVLVRRTPRASAPVRSLERLVAWTTRTALDHPRRVALGGALVLGIGAVFASTVEVRYKVFDDLRPGSTIAREIAAAEDAHGGLVPLAVHVEAEGGCDSPALHPEAIRAADRAAAFLRTFPEIRQANAIGDLLRPMHRALAGDDAEEDLPGDCAGVAQMLDALGDPRLAADFVSPDRTSLAVVGRAMDVGSARVAQIFRDVDRWVAREQARLDARPEGVRLRVSATGQLRLFQDVNELLLGGLAASFGGAVVVSLVVMSLALRSLRLGAIALVPNVAPVLLVLAFMGAAHVPLSPVTVMAFSLTLVIADDDTIQLLTRFRSHHAALQGTMPIGAAHRAAAEAALAEAGPPMVLSAIAVSAGFLLLLLSAFLGPARLGALIGVTLVAAVAADLFFTPALLVRFQPLARTKRALRARR